MTSPLLHLQAVTAFGLEAVVSREVHKLGGMQVEVEDGRVRFQGDFNLVCRANLWLRSADRVQIVIDRFEALDFGALFDQTNEVPWEDWIPAGAAFPVTGRSVKSRLHSVPDCQRIVKKAIVERLKRSRGGDWLDESGPVFAVEVAVLRDQVTLTIDTSGDGLHKRGYRKLTAAAPLRETLAAALVQLSVWNSERPFLDPFCGSGTIAIEAALYSLNRAPGLNRRFACEDWPQMDRTLWQEARAEAEALEQPGPKEVLIATDRDAEVLSLARYHAREAGVDDLIHFQQRSFSDLKTTRRFGCLITNPPYGERMGEAAEIEQLYRSMAHVLAPLETWSFFIITDHPGFERLFGREATRRRKLYNGRLACTYYQFLGPRPPHAAADRPSPPWPADG